MTLQQQLHAIAAQRDAGEPVVALAALRHLLVANPQSLDAHRLAADICEHSGDYDNARLHFEAMLAIQPEAVGALTGLGRLAHRAEAWDEVLNWFDRAAAIQPTHNGAFRYRAQALIALGRPAAAEQLLLQGLSSHPGDTELARHLFQLLFERDALPQAERISALLLQAHPHSEFLWRQHFRALRDQTKLNELLRSTEAARSALPDASMPIIERIRTLQQLGRYAEAQDAARALQPFIAQDAHALYMWCQLKLNLGQHRKVALALDEFGGTYSNRHIHITALLFQAKAALQEGNFATAAVHLEELLKLAHHHKEARYLREETAIFQWDIDSPWLQSDRWQVQELHNDRKLFPRVFEAIKNIAATTDAHGEIATHTAAIVAETPQCATATLYWLRHLALASQLFEAETEAEAAIPKRVFQYWHHTLPQDVADTMDTWKQKDSDGEYVLLDAAQGWARLGAHLPDLTYDDFAQLDSRLQADLVRWAVLHDEGGIWVNADCRRTRRLPDSLLKGRALVLLHNALGHIDTNFVATSPGHPLIKLTLQLACEAALAQPELPHGVTAGHSAVAMACAIHWGAQLRRDGSIHDGGLLADYEFKPYIAFAVPHAYHRLRHIPAALLEKFSTVAE